MEIDQATRRSLELTRTIADKVSVPVVASGGVGSLDHLRSGLADDEGSADTALAASIFHFGLYTIAKLKAAPTPYKRNVGQLLGFAWLAWLLTPRR